jgi:hypothetical protein
MDYQDLKHYAETHCGHYPDEYEWMEIARLLFKERDNIAAIIAQWDASEEGDVDALIRIQTILQEG